MAATVQEAVSVLQQGLAEVRDRTGDKLGLRLTKAEVELELNAVRTADATVEFKVFGIGASAGASSTWTNKHSVKLELTPAPLRPLTRSPADELAAAIIALAADAKAVKSQVAGQFTLGDFTLTVSFGFTEEGKAAIVVGGSGSQGATHTMTLTFAAF